MLKHYGYSKLRRPYRQHHYRRRPFADNFHAPSFPDLRHFMTGLYYLSALSSDRPLRNQKQNSKDFLNFRHANWSGKSKDHFAKTLSPMPRQRQRNYYKTHHLAGINQLWIYTLWFVTTAAEEPRAKVLE